MTEDQIQKVIQTVSTAGWIEVMQPVYANRARQALVALTHSAEERAGLGGEFSKLGDADLRAIIRENEWMLAVWQNQIKTYHDNRQLDELRQRQNGADSPLIPTANQ